MNTAMPLGPKTNGDILSKPMFHDLYVEIFEEGRKFFWRINSERSLELIIVFEDIEDFERSFDSRANIDFQAYKERFLVVVWTVTDPINPLGFPISFQRNELADVQALEIMFHQEEINIHYLSILDEELLHIYSQTSALTKEEKMLAKKILSESGVVEAEKESELEMKECEDLTEEQLTNDGIGYLLDYSALTNKTAEEQAKEKVMSALLSAINQFVKHPRPEVRDSSFLIWVGEKREMTKQGVESVLMEIFMTPPLLEIFDVVHDDQMVENPLSTVLLSFSEFLATIEAKPSERGAYPLLEYDSHSTYLIEPNEGLRYRLSQVNKTRPNPYMDEGDLE